MIVYVQIKSYFSLYLMHPIYFIRGYRGSQFVHQQMNFTLKFWCLNQTFRLIGICSILFFPKDSKYLSNVTFVKTRESKGSLNYEEQKPISKIGYNVVELKKDYCIS
eukprot:snap_masked-scaffold_43-processed-gene-1.80-mRNA-1 protein AED:1.00 eAED:1.00 QI:0/0/0/0/1/1/2/0/106